MLLHSKATRKGIVYEFIVPSYNLSEHHVHHQDPPTASKCFDWCTLKQDTHVKKVSVLQALLNPCVGLPMIQDGTAWNDMLTTGLPSPKVCDMLLAGSQQGMRE